MSLADMGSKFGAAGRLKAAGAETEGLRRGAPRRHPHLLHSPARRPAARASLCVRVPHAKPQPVRRQDRVHAVQDDVKQAGFRLCVAGHDLWGR